MDKNKIVVIGSLNMDWVIPVNHMPAEGETILAKGYTEVPGGKGANQAYAVGNLGGNVCMLGVIGKDELGQKLIKNLSRVGVDTSKISQLENENTGLALIYVNNHGENSIVVLPGANSQCDMTYIDSNMQTIKEADMIMLQMEIPQETVEYIIEKGYNLGKKIILNPAPAPTSLGDNILQKIDFITPNETELEKISGHTVKSLEDAKKAALILVDRGCKNVITTVGAEGAIWVTSESVKHFETQKVNPVDTTAAGDSFNAAMAVYLSEGHSVEEAIQFANKVSGIVVMRRGAQSSIPSREEIIL